MSSVRMLPAGLVLALVSVLVANTAGVAAQTEPDRDPDVTSIFAIWTPGPPPIRLRDFELRGLLTQEDRALLGQALEGGRVVVRGGERFGRAGEASGARMIVLFTGPLERAISLPLPDTSNVIYIQEGETFRRHPEDARVLTRVVELEPGTTPNSVLYRMDRLVDKPPTSGEIFIEVR